MGKKREIQEINASSMADIAFLLLIFFLVTTSMATDKGLSRTLPPPVTDEQKQDMDIKTRNILVVLINSSNQLMVNGEITDVRFLKEKVKEFVSNPTNDPNKPEKVVEEVPFFGQYPTMKNHVISLQNDRGTEYQAYISVQNELVAAYRELRDQLSRTKFGVGFEELDEERYNAIRKIYPQNISEAEPRNYGGSK